MTLYLEGSPEACLLQEVVQEQNQIWHLDGLKDKNAPFSQLTYSILAKKSQIDSPPPQDTSNLFTLKSQKGRLDVRVWFSYLLFCGVNDNKALNTKISSTGVSSQLVTSLPVKQKGAYLMALFMFPPHRMCSVIPQSTDYGKKALKIYGILVL